MTTDKPPPILERLQRLLAEGQTLSEKDRPPSVQVNFWTSKIRAVLKQLYGDNGTQVELCSPRVDDPKLTQQQRIAYRLRNLTDLANRIRGLQSSTKIFIGHGRSLQWLCLKIFLSDTLQLECDEFNIEPTPGIHTTDRIEAMLRDAQMAFLVMTAEDKHFDGTMHARENVIHEIGLFQARLGPRRAIVMLEYGCSKFSNLDGLTTINFPCGDISAQFEEVRRVLKREGLL